MAWAAGWKSKGGYCNLTVFETNGGDVSGWSWSNPPGLYGFCSFRDTSIHLKIGADIPSSFWSSATPYSIVDMAVFDIENQSAKTQLVVKFHMQEVAADHARAYVGVYKRIYSDNTTYTDTIYGTQQGPFGFNMTATPRTVWFQLVVAFIKYNTNESFIVGATTFDSFHCDGIYWRVNRSDFENWLNGGDIPSIESSDEFGKAAEKKGGYDWRKTGRRPTFDDHSDTITVSPAPTVSPINTGFFHQYILGDRELVGFADALFVDPGTAVDVLSAISELYEIIYARNRLECVLDLLIVPVEPTYGAHTGIRVGGKALQYMDDHGILQDVEGYPVTNPFVDFPCGSVTIAEYWANFLDFTGTKFKLFLPYIGYVDLQPEFINGGTIKVDYRFNTIDGSFMCYVYSTSTHSLLTESLIGQYSGMAAIHIPLQGNDYSQKLSGLISSAGSLATAALGAPAAAAAVGVVSSLTNTAVAKPGTVHGNGYNASSSYLSHRRPYLIIERQITQFSKKYPAEDGLPYYVDDLIGNCRGLTKASKAHLDGIPATTEEKEMIASLLAEGIIVDQLVS